MFGMNWIIGTGILWFFNLVFVNPIAIKWTKNKLEEKGLSLPKTKEEMDTLDEETKKNVESIFNQNYIKADILVLGIAGFLLGLVFGWSFIGFSLEAKGWPGMIVFIFSSLLGSMIHG